MNSKRIATCALLLAIVPMTIGAGRGGFDFHGDAGGYHPPQSFSHSSTGPAGTNRTTTATNNGNGYNRSTTASNGNYNRNVNASASNGAYSRNTNASNGYASHSSSSGANANTGNYGRTASGSDAYGTYSHSTTGTNVYGQTYHSSTSAYNGTVYHGAYVTNPVYHGYPAWGWNAGMAWYPAPYYYGGGFWGAMAIGAASAAVYGTIVANSQTITSYQVQPSSPGAKLLESYKLTQTPCGPAGLVVIYGPNNSAICAQPNALVAAGYYNVDSSNLSIVSAQPS
jgi:hypothetical protein